jgi:Fic family protein
VVKSCIFHYEFEFIHPFSDGNGRMGRMWQTLLLYQENSIFGWLPVEELVAANQQKYYKAINESTVHNDSAIFAQFMLTLLAEAVADFKQKQDKNGGDVLENVLVNVPANVRVNEAEKMALREIRKNPHITYEELSKKIKKTEKTVQRTISSLKKKNLIERVGSDKTGYWKIHTAGGKSSDM